MINVHCPGSKSITNRVILISALANGKSSLRNFLQCDDTTRMMEALKKLGIILKKNGKKLEVFGGKLKSAGGAIHCGNSGITMRFLAAVLSTMSFSSQLTGNKRMLERPIKDLVDGLRTLGAKIEYMGENGFPPIKNTGPLLGGKCEISGKISSQFLSALLIAAPYAKKNITIKIKGNLVSKPYVNLTIDIMRRFGVSVERNGYKEFRVKAGQKYRPQNFEIESDASSASYFWAIGALTNENFLVNNIPQNSLQADNKFLEIIKNYPRLPNKINCVDFPDSAMTLAILCAFTKGNFHLYGLENLRVKECDRLTALTNELNKMGCKTQQTNDGLKIIGNPDNLHEAKIETYNDHRIAMCFGVAKFLIPQIEIANPNCVKKTYPNFWRDIAAVKKKFQEKNIVLCGMRGSGKSNIGALLAKKIYRRYYDIDELMEQKAKKSISEIVKKHGWAYFRKLENLVAAKIAKSKNAIISTGGGTLMNPKNAQALKRNGKIIFLHGDAEVLIQRIRHSAKRPELPEDFIKTYAKRLPIYKKISDIIFDVSSNTINKKADLNNKVKNLLGMIGFLGLL